MTDMKKFLFFICTAITVLKSNAIAPSGSRVDYGDNEIEIPSHFLVIGLLVATVGFNANGMSKYNSGKRDAP